MNKKLIALGLSVLTALTPDPKLSKEFEDKALEYEDLIKDKQHQETAQKNQKKDKLYSHREATL